MQEIMGLDISKMTENSYRINNLLVLKVRIKNCQFKNEVRIK